MGLSEFDLIRQYFAGPSGSASASRRDITLGIGDDCALVQCQPGMEIAITVDTLVSGVHFLPDVDPEALGHKALAVNLSDLAAMGAEPAWCTLALTLPDADKRWLAGFAHGFLSLASRYGTQLIGGDTTRGPLSITVQAMGQVPSGQALRRAGAKPGDLIYVSGPLGGAGLGLKIRLGQTALTANDAILALERPEPRIDLGRRLRGLASACIDISDGLAADLGHLLESNRTGGRVNYEQIPLSESVRQYLHTTGDSSLPLNSGDDYELCFTVPSDRQGEVEQLLRELELDGQVIGEITAGSGLQINLDGQPMALDNTGYNHFPS